MSEPILWTRLEAVCFRVVRPSVRVCVRLAGGVPTSVPSTSSFCFFFVPTLYSLLVLQCLDTVGWASGRASGLYKLSDEVLVHMVVYLK